MEKGQAAGQNTDEPTLMMTPLGMFSSISLLLDRKKSKRCCVRYIARRIKNGGDRSRQGALVVVPGPPP